ncbi:macrophage migration inhibitory factor (MIF) domain-containing protein [Phthorimaea operculella]|nr:macrophage migration inhibitory factor (MIF) domain-containing protein [Phthorimaea operculella]
MPALNILTNLPKAKIPKDFVDKIIPTLSKVVNKPEQKFICVVSSDALLHMHGDSVSPGAVARLESIGNLGPEQNQVIMRHLADFVEKELGISPNSPGAVARLESIGNLGPEQNQVIMRHLADFVEKELGISPNSPFAVARLESIGNLGPEQNQVIMRHLADFVEKELGISPNSPGAVARLESIGNLGPEQNQVIMRHLADFVEKELGISPNSSVVCTEACLESIGKFICVVSSDALLHMHGDSVSPGAVARLESIGNLGPEQNQVIMRHLADFVEKELGISPNSDALLHMHGDSVTPGAVVRLESIGNLGPEQNQVIMRHLADFVEKELGISPNRSHPSEDVS